MQPGGAVIRIFRFSVTKNEKGVVGNGGEEMPSRGQHPIHQSNKKVRWQAGRAQQGVHNPLQEDTVREFARHGRATGGGTTHEFGKK